MSVLRSRANLFAMQVKTRSLALVWALLLQTLRFSEWVIYLL